MTIWDELRIATAQYMADTGTSTRNLAARIKCSDSKVKAFVPNLDAKGRIVERVFVRPTMAEPVLSNLVELLRDHGYIEPRVLIPERERA